MSDQYASGKGLIVKIPDEVIGKGYLGKCMFYPHCEMTRAN